MNLMLRKTKHLAKKIGIGATIIIPILILFSIWFAEIKMDSSLSIFLIVLICCAVCLVYILVYNKLEEKAVKRREEINDPFSK